MQKLSFCILAMFMVFISSAEAKDHSAGDLEDQKAIVASMANPPDFIITTTPKIDGYRIKEYKGTVRGVIDRQPTVGQGLSANLERMGGGKISAYVAMSDKARQQAFDLCVSRARLLGANALVGLSYDSTAFTHGDNVNMEVVCHGTAVVIEKDPRE